MKLSLLLSGAAIAQLASAHYFWETLIIDGKETKPYEFVRENTRAQKYNPTKWKNPLDGMTPDINDFRCNKGAFQSAGRTGVAEVKAGTKLALKLGVQATMQHPGPGFIHMSRAPGSVKEYEGDGDWFLVKQMGLCTKGDIKKEAWCTWDKNNIEFTIPEDLLEGEYLVRAMHVGVHGAHDGQAEFYPGCAQIKVVGSGKAVPKDVIKIPGFYKKDDPSWNFSVWGGYKDYPFPAQTVYQAGSGGGAQSPANPSPASPSPSPASPSPAAPVASSSPTAQPGSTQPEPSQPDYNEPETPQPAQPAQPAAQPSTPAQKPKCNKHSRRGRRAFRETLRK